MTREVDDFEAGKRAGLNPFGSAIDCPLVPGREQAGRRVRWLAGFASVRDNVKTPKAEPPPAAEQLKQSG